MGYVFVWSVIYVVKCMICLTTPSWNYARWEWFPNELTESELSLINFTTITRMGLKIGILLKIIIINTDSDNLHVSARMFLRISVLVGGQGCHGKHFTSIVRDPILLAENMVQYSRKWYCWTYLDGRFQIGVRIIQDDAFFWVAFCVRAALSTNVIGKISPIWIRSWHLRSWTRRTSTTKMC